MLFNTQHITSLFENATEGMVVSDSAGKIILVNPSACRMFGYTVDELLNREIDILIPEQAKGAHVHLRDGFYKQPTNRVMGHGRDLHGERKDGFNFPVEVSLSTYVKDDQRYVIAFIIDITRRKAIGEDMLNQRKQLEQITAEMRLLNGKLEDKVTERTNILKEALQKLEDYQVELSEALGKERQLNEIKSRFVSMASHEFRTPLSTVLSSASLAEKYTTTDDQPKRARHLEKIKTSVRHLNTMLDDFLSLGKLEEGKLILKSEDTDVQDLIDEVISECRESEKKSVRLFHKHDGTTTIRTDKNLLRNMLVNLVSNAIKFSNDAGDIEVKSSVKAGLLKVEVQDHGIGIPDEDQAHLFSTFFRGRNAVNIQGTGLGLHIVKRYVVMLGGELGLESRLGKGTRVYFSIPEYQQPHE